MIGDLKHEINDIMIENQQYEERIGMLRNRIRIMGLS
jgi:hypothetical protein